MERDLHRKGVRIPRPENASRPNRYDVAVGNILKRWIEPRQVTLIPSAGANPRRLRRADSERELPQIGRRPLRRGFVHVTQVSYSGGKFDISAFRSWRRVYVNAKKRLSRNQCAMKERKDKSRVPILAAGGIVLRNDSRPQFAIVRLRKPDSWGLPKGKLAAGEHAMAAARREVLEETGHRVTIHEFLGTLAYEASRRPKVVQFWRMQAVGEPIADLMRDVTAVDWLALEDAIDRLTHLRERVFLEQVGPIALKLAERSARRAAAASAPWLRTIASGVPLAPGADGKADERREWARPIEQELAECGPIPPADDVSAPAALSGQMGEGKGTQTGAAQPSIEKSSLKKTWGWLRHAAMSRR